MGALALSADELFDPMLLNKKYHYDSSTGNLYKKDRHLKFVNGKPYGNFETNKNKCGYIKVYFLGKSLVAHRVVWAMVYGEWPPSDKHIDHVNRVRNDNRITNLRLVDPRENNKNRSPKKKSKRGIKFSKDIKKYLKKQNLDYKEFSKIIGERPTAVRDWLDGNRVAWDRTIDRVMEKLGRTF